MLLNKKIAVITGGGTGIGRACALRFAAEGARVFVAGLDWPPLQEVVKEIERRGGEAAALKADVALPEDTERIIRGVTERFGGLHILLNNAATVNLSKRVQALTVEEWDQCLNATLRSVFLLTKLAAPEMKKAGGGVVVNLGSVGATMPWAEGAAYCSAKAGVLALTKVLAIEYGPDNIRVNAISPGAILTPNLEEKLTRPGHKEHLIGKSVLRRLGRPEEIAAAAAFLASDEASFVSSANLVADGGYLTL